MPRRFAARSSWPPRWPLASGEVEPLPAESPLWRLPQVMVLPHSAGHAAGNAARVAQIFLHNIARWLRGQPLVNVVV